jgi:uncharacterized iron-regulated protein
MSRCSCGRAMRSDVMRASCLAPLVFAIAAAATLAGQSSLPAARVFATARSELAGFGEMLTDVATADVVIVGEERENPAVHQIELVLLQELAARRKGLTLSLEVLDRGMQEPLEHFLMGHTAEADFLTEAKPPADYARTYKPLVDAAIQANWQVVAANVPPAVAEAVRRSGPDVLTTTFASQKAVFARDVQCPATGQSFERFKSRAAAQAAAGRLEFAYYADCLADETMAESIARAYAAGATGGKRPLVVHVTAAVHADFGDGVVLGTRRRLPTQRIAVLTIQPVADLNSVMPDANARSRADYILYTTETR